MTRFVSSRDVPEDLAERVARVAHRRGCGSFNGRHSVPAPRFEGSHRGSDVVWSQIHIADLCNAVGITPDQIVALGGEPSPWFEQSTAEERLAVGQDTPGNTVTLPQEATDR